MLHKLSHHRFRVVLFPCELGREEGEHLIGFHPFAADMIKDSSVGEETEVAVIVDDMNGRHWVLIAFLANPDDFLSADVVSVEVNPRAPSEQQLVTSERLVVLRMYCHFLELHPPHIFAKVVLHCVLCVGPILIGMLHHILSDWPKFALSWHYDSIGFENF